MHAVCPAKDAHLFYSLSLSLSPPPGAENPSLELCTQLIQKYEPTDEGKAQVNEIEHVHL